MRGLGIAASLMALALATGCASVSPERIKADRSDYGQVIAKSWKRQTLLNVVRLRYADPPMFLAGQVIGSVIWALNLLYG